MRFFPAAVIICAVADVCAMTPADKRVSELLDRWVASLELHQRYLDLTDDAYWKVQPWPKHDRPNRWIVELALQRTLELRAHYESRRAMGDTRFAEALELTAFLATLVGLQNLERFIPLADPSREGSGMTVEASAGQSVGRLTRPAVRPVASQSQRPRPETAQAATGKIGTGSPGSKTSDKPAARSVSPPAATGRDQAGESTGSTGIRLALDRESQIIADAVRLLRWGRLWHELPELIGKLDGRPPAAQIRQVLRAQRRNIEREAGING